MNHRKPPIILEQGVTYLLPHARREEVIGDLHERYTSSLRYVLDALGMLPAILWSQVRRTTDLSTFAIESVLLYGCFLASALWFEPHAPSIAVRALVPAALMELGFVVAHAYGNTALPAMTLPTVALFGARTMLPPEWLPSHQPLGTGFGAGLTVLFVARLLFAKRRRGREATAGYGGSSMPSQPDKHDAFRSELRRNYLGLVLAAIFLGVMGVFAYAADTMLDRLTGALIVSVSLSLLYQTWRQWSAVTNLPYESQLRLRRDQLRSIGWWYVFPYLAALLLFVVRLPLGRPAEPGLWTAITPFTVLSIVWSVAALRISRRAAAKLESEINHLEPR